MRSLSRRLELLAGQVPKASLPPASRRWFVALHLARRFLDPWIPAQDRDRAARNIDKSTLLLDEYFRKAGASCPYVEYFCNACVLRLSYTTPDWRGREWVVVDEAYEEHLRQVWNPGRTIDAESR
jgi:hypothetical protein